jgi:hypothetical protein
VTYATLAKGRDTNQMRELDLLLAPSKEASQAVLDRANMNEMRKLGAGKGPKPVPLRRRKKEPVDG